MSKEKFPTVVKALITCKGEVLIGQKEDDDDHPIGGEWHFLGGHLEKDERLEEAIKREVKEETGLDVDVHQVIDIMAFPWDGGDELNGVQILYHCEAEKQEAEAKDDLQEVKWVDPEDLKGELGEIEAERIESREKQRNFIDKLEKMPAF